METLTELLMERAFGGRFITTATIDRLAGGGPARRWGLVNRALDSGEMIRLMRGLYVLSPAVSRVEISRLSIANRILPESYVSLESSLAFHGWLEEEPFIVQSCFGQGLSRIIRNVLGEYSYERIPVDKADLLRGVERVSLPEGHAMVASPERALCDTAFSRKMRWEGIIGLCERLRTDVTNIYRLDAGSLKELSEIYSPPQTRRFVSRLIDALVGDR